MKTKNRCEKKIKVRLYLVPSEGGGGGRQKQRKGESDKTDQSMNSKEK